jgi:hypothetical protein
MDINAPQDSQRSWRISDWVMGGSFAAILAWSAGFADRSPFFGRCQPDQHVC